MLYLLEYDGNTFHKNYLVEYGFEEKPNSNGYTPLAVVEKGSKLESLLQVMVFTIRSFEKLRPSFSEVSDIVDYCKSIAKE